MEAAPHAVRESLAQAIRELRARRRLSQEALAESAELSRNFVGLVERGEASPSFGNVVRIAAALGVSITDLVRLFEERLAEHAAAPTASRRADPHR